ncbi:hypothetical protein DMB66_57630 [Actinoplanes sp. ATCC 53533]|uniref:hypothetical protein n=1 Tax=Actinoplanes sp. ATCC 53533 TaxID=1288362 RepID=UPI000F7841D3|nr:hypothetical protein [Actinoplanes sp. ATCC 53533]RSM40069.1 hypothetical protein DMB66_57630 [Actinoplanes sp. ATCC 53533]
MGVSGIFGGLAGMVNGALTLGAMTAAYPWQKLYAGDPRWPVAVLLGQVLVAVVVGGLYVWWPAATEAARLRIGGGDPVVEPFVAVHPAVGDLEQ